ncbi:MAG: PRC-barrel domain-containing protein [Dongiaceae bacterium]
MRRNLLAAAALLTALSAPAWGQSADTAETTAPAPSAESPAISLPPAGAVSANDVIGIDVVNVANEKIGAVNDLLIENENQVALAVISVGGFLGVGDKLVTLPYDELQIMQTDGGPQIVAHMTKEQLEALPSFQYEASEPAAGGYDSSDATNAPTTTQTATTTTDFDSEKQSFTDEYGTQIQSWDDRVAEFGDQAAAATDETRKAASAKVDEAWTSVKTEWDKLQAATADSWEATKLSFQEAWDSFTKTWDEANET